MFLNFLNLSMISDCLNGVLARYLVIKKDDKVTVEFIYIFNLPRKQVFQMWNNIGDVEDVEESVDDMLQPLKKMNGICIFSTVYSASFVCLCLKKEEKRQIYWFFMKIVKETYRCELFWKGKHRRTCWVRDKCCLEYIYINKRKK